MKLRLWISLASAALAIAGALVPSTALAAGTLRFVDIVVGFVPAEIDREPSWQAGSIVIANATKSTQVEALSDVIRYRPEMTRGTPGFSFAGPWKMTLLTDLEPSALVAALGGDPVIAYAELPRFTDTAEELIAGEAVTHWFPAANKDGFCNQWQMHHRLASEDPILVDDPCSLSGRLGPVDHDMDMPQAWGITRGDSNIVVAIIDTGCDIIHPNLGGAGPLTAVADSMAAYNQGIWFRNWRESPGDANFDGFPGEQGVDDDLDGLVDEDSMGREPDNTQESDVMVGEWTSVGTYTLTDSTANWTEGALVGKRLYGAMPGNGYDSGIYEIISDNTNITITTSSSFLLGRYVTSGKDGWRDLVSDAGTKYYKIADGLDNDGDGFVDDVGYLDDLSSDDDENGFIDDFHGWDFVEGPSTLPPGRVACPNDDMLGQDNDPRTLWEHGTAVASQVASVLELGRMMGGAPAVRVLPLRVLGDYMCGPVYGYSLENPAAAVEYARMMGADIISLSFNNWVYRDLSLQSSLRAAMSDGILVVAAAGNANSNADWPATYNLQPAIVVAGLDEYDLKWSLSDYGQWVDVASRGRNFWVCAANIRSCPAWSTEHGNQDGWNGTSLSAPTVAAVAGLAMSVYPDWTDEEVADKLLQGVDDIYASGMNSSYVGLLGSGRVNAYRALTFYGDIPAQGDTTWSHNIWIGGDVKVPEGRLLTITEGDTVRVAIDDLLYAGANPNEIEFVIDGTLQINGTTSAPVVFESLGGSHPRWTYNHAITISGETFTCGGLGCAAIASSASYQLKPDVSTTSQVFAVRMTPAAPLSSVTVDLGGLGLTGTTLQLLDNGAGEDLVPGDGIYTSNSFSALLAPGAYTVQVSANAAAGGYTRRAVSVEVPDLVAKFTDVSSQVGLNYTGKPYSAMNGNVVSTGQAGMVVATSDSYSPVYRTEIPWPSGAPRFSSPGVHLAEDDARGLAAADFDNDGDEDVFVANTQTPKLWQKDSSGTYVDVTSAMGLATLAASSASACWGDFDNDGWLDLFVTRCGVVEATEPPDRDNILFAQHRLFRNMCGSSGGFLDVTSAAGLDGVGAPVGLTAAWGDLEGDGDLDLVVPDISDLGYGSTALYVNYGNGTFVNERSSRFTTPGQYWGYDVDWGSGVVWADMDNDEDLDIVVSCAGPGSRVLLNNGQGQFPAALSRLLSTSADKYSGVQVLDHNLDGWPDVLLLSGDAGHPSRLFLGKPTVDGVEFVENTHNAGLAHTSKGMGILSADFTADGDSDVFVGRRTADGQYFYKTDDQSGANSLGRRYVKVRLESPIADYVNRQGIGSVISVAAGGMVQSQVVDGGSGRGGQSDRTLTFGLGDYVGQVTATVRWPGGVVQSDVELVVSGAGAPETVNVISDAAPVVSNVNVATYIVPGISFYDWEFSWDTDMPTKAAGDVVTFIQDGIDNPCWPGWVTLSPSSPGAIYTYVAKASGGYTHKLRLNHEPCNLGCSFYYTVTSDTGLHSVTSTPPKFKKVKLCPTEY